MFYTILVLLSSLWYIGVLQEVYLNKFLIFYNFNRRHGSLRKELKVRTPFDAVQSWFQTKPEIFKILPSEFQDIAFEMVQRGET